MYRLNTAIFDGGAFRLGVIITIAYQCITALRDCVISAHLVILLAEVNKSEVFIQSVKTSLSMYTINCSLHFFGLILLIFWLIRIKTILLLIWLVLISLSILCRFVFLIIFATVFRHKWVLAALPISFFEIFLAVVVFLYFRQQHWNILGRIRLHNQSDQTLENK